MAKVDETAPVVEETAPEVLNEVPEEVQPGDVPGGEPVVDETAAEADPAAPADDVQPDPVPEGTACPICFPYGPPAGAVTFGCEHTS